MCHLFYLSSVSCSPFPALPPLSLAFHPHPPLFCFVCCGSSYEPEMLLRCFHKELRFQPLSRRMADGGGEWGCFRSCSLMPLSCIPPPTPFFHTVLLHLIPGCRRRWCCGWIRGQRMRGIDSFWWNAPV